ncbi:hypothetical protein RN001_009796 [Aquatica leii]|uniref:Uncharacterized protein n=1 Tax=Aquatica leii TaxID=1421715 RepID=A0AAN7SQ27_9COLE|nr:hypothetical protein RN001_009796 [Aquatica leii]
MAHLIRKLISTFKAPKPVAPYSQAVVWDRTVYVSGVLGLDKDSMQLVPGGTSAETRQALVNLGYILEAADSGYAKVVKTTILLKNMNDFVAVNEVYKEFFKTDYPARTAYQVTNLPLNANVEIEVIAGTGDVSTIHSKFATLRNLLKKWPGEKYFGVYRFLPLFFILGAALEFSMINWKVGEINFYRTFKKRQAKNIVDKQVEN